MLNLTSSPGGRGIVSVWLLDDLDRPLEVAGRLEIGDEIRQAGERRAPAVDHHFVWIGAVCFSSVSHSIGGSARLI